MPAIRIVAGDRRPAPPAGLCSLDALRAIRQRPSNSGQSEPICGRLRLRSVVFTASYRLKVSISGPYRLWSPQRALRSVGPSPIAHRTWLCTISAPHARDERPFPLASQTRAEPYQCHQWWVGQPSIAPV
jgi:hypothetical protein